MGIAQYENAAIPLRSRGISTTHQHFQMRYITLIYLKGLKSYWLKQKCKVCFTTETTHLKIDEPLDLKQNHKPQLKELVSGINAYSYQWCGCIFMMCYTHLKLALLLHKTVLVNFPIGTTVPTFPKIGYHMWMAPNLFNNPIDTCLE